MDHISWSLEIFSKTPLASRPNTKSDDHGTPNARNRWLVLFLHAWGRTWIKIHWNSIRLRVRSHMTSHYTWRSMTTLRDFGGMLGWPYDTFFWALKISCHGSWLICEVTLRKFQDDVLRWTIWGSSGRIRGRVWIIYKIHTMFVGLFLRHFCVRKEYKLVLTTLNILFSVTYHLWSYKMLYIFMKKDVNIL